MPRGDVFPRRNLPDVAQDWGRKLEERVARLERDLSMAEENGSASNRTLQGLMSVVFSEEGGIITPDPGPNDHLLFQWGEVTTTSPPSTSRQTLIFPFPEAFASFPAPPPTLFVEGAISAGGTVVTAMSSIGQTTATEGGIFYTASGNASNNYTFKWLAIGVRKTL